MQGLGPDPPLWIGTEAQLGPRLLDARGPDHQPIQRWWQIWWREARQMWRMLWRAGT